MLFMHRKCQNIDHDEDTKEFEDYFSFNRFDRTEVEPSPTGRYSSQLQLSPQPKMLVSHKKL